MKKDDAKKFAVGAAIAGVAGYVAGILTAPKSGKETREDVKAATAKAKRDAENQLKKLHGELNELLDKAKGATQNFTKQSKEEVDKLIARAKSAKEKVRQNLSSIHEGATKDKDLQKAITEANEAVGHLRDWLKKNGTA